MSKEIDKSLEDEESLDTSPEETTETDALEMSDEDIADMDFDTFQEKMNNPEDEEDSQDEEDSEEDDQEEDSEEVDEDDSTEERHDSIEAQIKEIGTKASPKAKETSDEASDEVPDSDDTIDYTAEYKRLLAPFKANGKDMQVSSVDDARQLMQMGANYNKKMAALKPGIKVLKTLENNGLLDEAKINFLIDLDKKNPEAIAKFLKDSEIDPLDLDLDEDKTYNPTTYTADQKEIDLDEILDEIRETPSFQKTIDEVTNKWDQPSRDVLLENPNLLRVINGHVEGGIYDQIMGVVEQERMLGRLQGFSDLQAYKEVGDAIDKQGGFNPATVPKAKPTAKRKQDQKLSSRKKAASSTNKGTARKGTNDFNPLALSDEEFEKAASSQFL